MSTPTPLSYKNDSEADERLNPASDSARRLKEQENDALPGYDRANDGLDDHPITAGNASGKSGDLSGGNTKNIDDVGERERAGSDWKTDVTGNASSGKKGGKLWARIGKKGPFGIIIGLAFGGGFLGFSGLSLLPVAIVQSFTNDTNYVNASQQRKSVHLFGMKMGGTKADIQKKMSLCKGHVSINCQFNSLSEKTIKRFEDKKFTFGDKVVVDGMVGYSSLKFPDGTVVTNAAELNNALRKIPGASFAFNSVYSLRNQLFVVGKFAASVLNKMGLTKAKKFEGDSKKEVDDSFKESTKKPAGEDLSVSSKGGENDPNATEEQKKAAAEANAAGSTTEKTINDAIKGGKKLKTLSLKVGNALAIPQLMCLTYNMANVISITAKTVKMARIAAFAMMFLTYAGSLMAGKNTVAESTKATDVIAPSSYPEKIPDPNDSSKIIPNPNIGKNASDAEAAQVVMNGASINLSAISKRFFAAGGFLGVLDVVITWMNEKFSKDAIKTTCKIVNSTVATVIGFLAAPIFSIVISFLPVDQWAADLVNLAIDAAAGIDFTTGITGPDAGNVIFIGTAYIMGKMAMSYGLKPGKLPAVLKNLSANYDAQQQEVALERYAAQKTPFALDNRYSLFGSMAYSFAGYMPKGDQPILATAGKLLSAIPLSLSGFTKNVGAAYTMPVQGYNESRFNQCPDPVYKSMSQYFDTDMGCVQPYVPYDEVAAKVVVDYMKNNGQITDPDTTDGGAVPSSDYSKYIKYCNIRTEPWGSTTVAIEDQTDGADWYTGVQCLKPETQQQMGMFSEYTGYKITNDNINADPNEPPDGGGGASGGGTSSAAPPECATMAADDLGQIACHASQFNDYGYSWGGGHSGTAAAFMADFKAGAYTAGKDHILDCSGLVRMAIFDATGVDIGGIATPAYPSYSKFQEISKTDAKIGDILWKDNHTEIVISNDTVGQKWQTFGAHEVTPKIDDDIGYTTYPYSGFTKVFRFVK